MELKKLERGVLKLWYVRAAALATLPLAGVVVAGIILGVSGAASTVAVAVLLGVGVPAVLLLALILLLPYFRYKRYAWGYDDKTIVVHQGVIFRKRVVIPVCQIQDLHRFQGPLMMLFQLSGVTISTAGSNFDISTLTTAEADTMIDELEQHLEARMKEHRYEEI